MQTPVGFPRFLGQLFDAFGEPSVGLAHLIGKFADSTLRGAPQLAVFLAVFAELLRKTGGKLLNPVQPFLSGYKPIVS
jgi:hypothetical protein